MQAGLPLRPPQIAPACPSNRLGEGSGLPLYISDWTRRWPARCLRLVKTYGAVQLWLWMGHIAQLRSSLLTQPLLSKLSASAPLPILFASCRQFPPLHPTLTLPAPFFLAECTGSSAGWVSRRHAPWASPHQPSAEPSTTQLGRVLPCWNCSLDPPASMRPATRVSWLTAAKNDWLQGPSLTCWVIAENSLFEAEDTAFSTCFLMLMNVAPSPAQSLPCLLPCSFSSLFPILSPLSNHAASCSCDLTLKIPHCRDSASPGLSWIWRHVLGGSLGLCVWGLNAPKTQWQPQGDS